MPAIFINALKPSITVRPVRSEQEIKNKRNNPDPHYDLRIRVVAAPRYSLLCCIEVDTTAEHAVFFVVIYKSMVFLNNVSNDLGAVAVGGMVGFAGL